MAILFGSEMSATPLTLEETEQNVRIDEARGHIPQALLREDFIHRKHTEYDALKGSFIEINRDACTDDEYAALSAGKGLTRDNYGNKWRIWTGGFPTDEQMAATPWEQVSDDSQLET